jgi:peroxiredoxin
MNQINPIEAAFLEVRSSGASLTERLQVVAEAARVHKPEYSSAVDAFVARLRAVQAGADAPKVGDMMPQFILPDQDGRLVTLDGLLARGPVVVALHRGHWCPFCRLNMIGLAEIEDRLKPAQIVAISTETQRYTRMLREQAGARFPFLTDMDAGYTMSMDLAVWLDDRLANLIAEAGWDIPLYQGGSDWVLPIPAVFVVCPSGKIAARHIDPDYRYRMAIDELLASVGAICTKG